MVVLSVIFFGLTKCSCIFFFCCFISSSKWLCREPKSSCIIIFRNQAINCALHPNFNIGGVKKSCPQKSSFLCCLNSMRMMMRYITLSNIYFTSVVVHNHTHTLCTKIVTWSHYFSAKCMCIWLCAIMKCTLVFS